MQERYSAPTPTSPCNNTITIIITIITNITIIITTSTTTTTIIIIMILPMCVVTRHMFETLLAHFLTKPSFLTLEKAMVEHVTSTQGERGDD